MPIIFENENSGQSRKVSYEELATLAQTPFDQSFCLHSIPDFISPFLTSSAIEDYAALEKIISIVGTETSVIFHGVGEENVPKIFNAPWIIEGQISKLSEVVKALNENAKIELVHFPNYIFPLDKSWCLGNLIPQSNLFLIGCNATIAQELCHQNELEVVEILADDKYFEFPSN